MSRSSHVAGCSELRQAGDLARREVLRLGSLSGLGLTLPTLLAQRARGAQSGTPGFGRAKQVIGYPTSARRLTIT